MRALAANSHSTIGQWKLTFRVECAAGNMCIVFGLTKKATHLMVLPLKYPTGTLNGEIQYLCTVNGMGSNAVTDEATT